MSDYNQNDSSENNDNTTTDNENESLVAKIENLRPKLLDSTKKNPLVSTKFNARGNNYIRFVDEIPENIYLTVEQGEMILRALPPMNKDPEDENNETFKELYAKLCIEDEEYLEKIESIDNDNADADELKTQYDRELKDKAREILGLPPRPQETNHHSLRQHAELNGINPKYDLPTPEEENEDGRHEDIYLQTLMLSEQLERHANRLYTKGRDAIKETGVNIIQIAFGFLEWSTSNDSTRTFSPVCLMEVDLIKEKTPTGPEFKVQSLGSELSFNFTLNYKLRDEHGIELPVFNGNEEEFEDYFCKVEKLLKDSNLVNPKIRRQVVLGAFPSSKIAMYKDLDPNSWPVTEHPIVAPLIGIDSTREENISLPEDDFESNNLEIDELSSDFPLLPTEVDSSQYRVIKQVLSGKNTAVEGPPGTGKSQTIVNTIVAAITSGKKVLFVAEKADALTVVKSRINAIGLGDFVLPIVAKKTNKPEFYKSLKNRLELSTPKVTEKHLGDLQSRARNKRKALNKYVNLLTSNTPIGLSVKEVLNGYSIRQNTINHLMEHNPNIILDELFFNNIETLLNCKNTLDQIDKIQSEIPNLNSFWDIITNYIFHPNIKPSSLKTCGKISNDLEYVFDILNSTVPLNELLNFSTPDALGAINIALDANKNLGDELKPSLFEISCFNQDGIAKANTFIMNAKLLLEKKSQIEKLVEKINGIHNTKKLEKVIKLAESVNFELLSKESIESNIERSNSNIANLETCYNKLKNLTLKFQEDSTLKVNRIVKLFELIKKYPLTTWVSLQENFLFNHTDMLAIERMENTRLNLVDELEVLNTDYNLKEDDLFQELENFYFEIFQSGPLSIFSSHYRKAKKNLLRISKSPKFNRKKAQIDVARMNQLKMKIKRYLKEISQDKQVVAKIESINTSLKPDMERLELNNILLEVFDLEIVFKITQYVSSLDSLKIQKFASEQFDMDLLESFSDLTLHELNEVIDRMKTKLVNLELLKIDYQDLDKDLRLPQSLELSNLKNLRDQYTKYFESTEALKRMEIFNQTYPSWEDAVSDIDNIESHMPYLEKTAKLEQVTTLSVSKLISCTTDSALVGKLEELKQKIENAYAKEQELFSAIRSSKPSFFTKKINITQLRNKFKRASQGDLEFDIFNKYAKLKADAKEKNLDQFLTLNDIPFSKFEYLEASFYRQLLDKVFTDNRSDIEQTLQMDPETAKQEYIRVDREYQETVANHAKWLLKKNANPPGGNSSGRVTTYTDLALIKHECAKITRQISVRDLCHRSRDALLHLKPCWMMSPLAVSQYLEKIPELFDLVIVDEASQMRPENAIGALLRAKNCMIVGDTNQLPPTNFFASNSESEDQNEDEHISEESILNQANISFYPKLRLLWHYRSKHPDLIAFSNKYIYDSSLVTFPSPIDGGLGKKYGIELREVEGNYNNSINTNEAKAMVLGVIQLMADHPDMSIGMVVMNSKQRELLISEFDILSAENEAIAKYREHWQEANEGLEEFFIKNLESVQGDERDIIVIGTVYGKEPGKERMPQRFGPILGKAGKRRLNVLFSRAKKKIITYTSMKPTDILAQENGNPGAYLLRQWLEFSKTGVLESGIVDNSATPENDFEQHIFDTIKELGYEPVAQVGVNGYFIDIGVRHPSWPYGFIMGVECDGATYHSSKYARERDRLREEVLNGLGWELHRIWSTNWFKDTNAEIKKLKRALREKLSELLSQSNEYRQKDIVEKKPPQLTTEVPVSPTIVLRQREEQQREVIKPNIGKPTGATGLTMERLAVGEQSNLQTSFNIEKPESDSN